MNLGAAPLHTETYGRRNTLELLAEAVAKFPGTDGTLTELRLYRRSDNCFACSQLARPTNGKAPGYSILVTDDAAEARDFFGKGSLAQQLFTQLERKALHLW